MSKHLGHKSDLLLNCITTTNQNPHRLVNYQIAPKHLENSTKCETHLHVFVGLLKMNTCLININGSNT